MFVDGRFVILHGVLVRDELQWVLAREDGNQRGGFLRLLEGGPEDAEEEDDEIR